MPVAPAPGAYGDPHSHAPLGPCPPAVVVAMASPRRNASPGAAAAAAGRDAAQSDSPTYTTATPRSRFAAELSPDAFDEPGAGEVPSAKESVTATVRFRPLSSREIRQGEEIAWYADGETIVRSEHNPNIAYAYDRVFGPTTTTQQVYDVAAQHVVSGAMQGINGTIFAYGVTSSGKTHTMHGDQRSPGIIPLAVKDAFGIIQETLNREFLLRVSYLEIYNEVVNDLLNPAGKNLRIREDLQGTFVEGIKEEVVLSPTHVLSLIAAGEEHRHVGSTNFNLLSSRSHTIFTLTVESSQVISKLTDGKATHVPFRNSKLTRLLQSSLSGQGRVSLICTVTPASSNSEETHNTLKFAHRSKHIEIQALQNKITDEKSLIKKYQSEIRQLREELEQLKRGIFTATPLKVTEDNIILWKQKLEDGNVKLQSRLEQEEEAKAALLGRIQRLTKLILVSTRATQTTRSSQHPGTRRRHSFGEGELAYLPHRRRDIIVNSDRNELVMPMEGFGEALEMSPKEEKQSRKGLLNWFKLRKRDSGSATLACSDGGNSSLTKSFTAPSARLEDGINFLSEQRTWNSMLGENVPADFLSVDLGIPSDSSPVEEIPSVQSVSRKSEILDDVDLSREQLKISSGEAVLHANVVKHLTEEAGISGMNKQIEMEIKVVNDEIKCKQQIASLESQNASSVADSQGKTDTLELAPYYAEILKQLNEKAFQLEVKTADNRILEGQLEKKASECEELQETVVYLKEQIVQALQIDEFLPERVRLQQQTGIGHDVGSQVHNDNPLSSVVSEKPLENTSQSEIDELKQKLCELTEAKAQLEVRNQELLEESTYAKGLASAAGVELRALSEEVTKLVKQNEKLASELASARNSSPRKASHSPRAARMGSRIERHEPGGKRDTNSSSQREQALEMMLAEKEQREAELKKKIEESKQKEAFLEGELANIWTLVAKLKKAEGNCEDDSDVIHDSIVDHEP